MNALLRRRPRCHRRDTDTKCPTCGKEPAWMALAREWEKLKNSEDVDVNPWNFQLAFSLNWRQNTPSSSDQADPVTRNEAPSPDRQPSRTQPAKLPPPLNTRAPTSGRAVRTDDGNIRPPVDTSWWPSAPNGAPFEGSEEEQEEEERVGNTREGPTALTDDDFTLLIPKGFTAHVPSAMNGGPEDGVPGVTPVVMPSKVGRFGGLFGGR